MDQVALVTGADRGLGLALTQSLLDSGWIVIAGQYLDWPELGALAERFPESLHMVPLDISSDESVRDAAQKIEQAVDHIDVLIANAGILSATNTLTIRESPSYGEMIREFNVNAVGALRVVEAFLPLLDRGNWKRLCFLSSEAGSIAASTRNAWFGYCMSKAALNMAVKNLSNDLTPAGFSFRLYYPGWMRTYMHGPKNLDAHLEPEEGATFALKYFLSQEDPPDLRLHSWDGTDMPW